MDVSVRIRATRDTTYGFPGLPGYVATVWVGSPSSTAWGLSPESAAARATGKALARYRRARAVLSARSATIEKVAAEVRALQG